MTEKLEYKESVTSFSEYFFSSSSFLCLKKSNEKWPFLMTLNENENKTHPSI